MRRQQLAGNSSMTRIFGVARRLAIGVCVASGLVASGTMGGCQQNSATGGSVFNLFSMEQEIALGEQSKGQLTAEYGGQVPDRVPSSYLVEVGERLSAEVEDEFLELPWEYTLLDSNVINAFALPGGKVFMSRALAERLPDEASLAAVVGHEIGHVTARHGGRRITQAYSVQFGASALVSLLSGMDSSWLSQIIPYAVVKGGEGYLLKYNRDQELEADKLGMRYMTRAGYDPSAIIDVMLVLQDASGGNAPPEFLSTHPHPESRIGQANDFLEGQYAFTVGNPAYSRYRSRYQQRMLNPLALLRAERGETFADAQPIDLSRPETWCAHCAVAHAHDSDEDHDHEE